MKKILLMLLVVLLLCTLCACDAPAPAPVQEPDQEQSAPVSEAPTSESVVDNTVQADSEYIVELKDAEKVTGYDGEDILVVYYSFTNNSDEDESAMWALMIKGFQDGIELEKAYFDEDVLGERSSLYDADMKEIKPGVTIDCLEKFVLDSDSPVEVEVTELISFDDEMLATKTYDVK